MRPEAAQPTNKTISWCLYIFCFSIWLIISFSAPWVLSDNNDFLKSFINHELLTFLGIFVTITISAIANIHLELNKLEEQLKKRVFVYTRHSIKRSAFWLVGMLLISFLIIISKPLVVSSSNEIGTSLFNGGGLIIVIFNVLILIDILQTTFKLEPNYEP
jgi:hypothetical protein